MTEVLSEHNMMTVEELTDQLAVTDTVEEYPFDYGRDAKVQLEIIEQAGGVKLHLVFGERDEETGKAHEYELTQDSAEQLFKQVKLPAALLESVPLMYTVPVMNWFLANQPGSLKALTVKTATGVEKIASFCRVGTEIYSSVDMLHSILNELENGYGITDVLVANFTHDLKYTNYTLLFPQSSEQIEDTGEVLLSGINFQSSVLGLKPTMLHGVVARDYHFNSMVSATSIQQWNRKQAKSSGLEDIVNDDAEAYDVYDWLGETAKALWSHRNSDLVAVKRLRRLSLHGHSSEFMSDVFNKFSIPTGTRNLIRMSFAEQEENTIYGLWNAITEIAQDNEVQEKPALVRKLMEVGGELAFHPEACSACHRLKDLE